MCRVPARQRFFQRPQYTVQQTLGGGLCPSQRQPEPRPARGRRRRRRQRVSGTAANARTVQQINKSVNKELLRREALERTAHNLTATGGSASGACDAMCCGRRFAHCIWRCVGAIADYFKTMHPLLGLSQCELQRAKDLRQAVPGAGMACARRTRSKLGSLHTFGSQSFYRLPCRWYQVPVGQA